MEKPYEQSWFFPMLDGNGSGTELGILSNPMPDHIPLTRIFKWSILNIGDWRLLKVFR